MICPNCENDKEFYALNNNGQNFKGKASGKFPRVVCLKCGWKFSKIIEKRYSNGNKGTKNSIKYY